MSLKQNLSEVQLLKFKNIRIVYLTPKNDLWAIFDSGIKKCITKNFGVIIELPKFLKDKNLISYKDSLKIKKGVSFIILVNNSIDITLKKKIINIEILNKQIFQGLSEKSELIPNKSRLRRNSKVIKKANRNTILDVVGTKNSLGQFYTTNCEYIFKGMVIPKDISLIEPFGGSGELLEWIYKKINIHAESYDIDPKLNHIVKRDVLKNVPIYKDKFVITNPPYLAKSKSKDKSIFDLYRTDDLYKCFILQLLNDPCVGGMLIVPLNFFCSFRKKDLNLRKFFLEVYDILLINIFEEPVFSDTCYTVCSFMFKKKVHSLEILTRCNIYPSKIFFSVFFNIKNYYSFSGNILNLPKSTTFAIERLTKLNFTSEYATNILVQCIDNKKKINASIVTNELVYIDNTKNMSARSYLSLLIEPKISFSLQKKLVLLFFKCLEKDKELPKNYFKGL